MEQSIKLDNNSSKIYESSNLINNFIQTIHSSDDKQLFIKTIQNYDQLYHYYASQNYQTNPISKELYELPSKSAVKLNIPKQYSLADSMLRSTLGCEQKLAQSYMKLIDLTDQKESQAKIKRVQQAKKKFSSYNSHHDFFANSKPFMIKTKFAEQRPVIESQHDSYLKTHLTFLDNPSSSLKTKSYYSKQNSVIANKIIEIGGIEDAIGPIETSLNANQIKNVKKRQKMERLSDKKEKGMSPSASRSSLKQTKERQTWLNQSKMLRQTLTAKLITS